MLQKYLSFLSSHAHITNNYWIGLLIKDVLIYDDIQEQTSNISLYIPTFISFNINNII